MKKCPFCSEEIQDEAIKCKHCGSDLTGKSEAKKPTEVATKKKTSRVTWLASVLIILVIVVVAKISDQVKKDVAVQSATDDQIAQQKAAADQKAMQDPVWKKSKAGQICASHPVWTKDDCDNLAAKKIWIGMTYDMLVLENGKPDSSNPSNYGSGTQMQYCWNTHTPSCFYDNNNDGIIDSYN